MASLKTHKLFNKILNHIGKRRFSHISPWNTLLLNLRSFDFLTALNFPIFVYNNVETITLGSIIIDVPLKRGMIKIGNQPMKALCKTKIRYQGKMIFHGETDIWGGSIIEGNGILEFGDKTRLGENVRIMCFNHIKFCGYNAIGYDTVLMDTDFHFLLDVNKKTVKRNSLPIVIGEGTWLSSNCKIMKGSQLPSNSIVVGGSLINANFRETGQYQIFAGTPAKPIRNGYRRLFNIQEERKLTKYFKNHPNEHTVEIESDELDIFCFSNFWKYRKND